MPEIRPNIQTGAILFSPELTTVQTDVGRCWMVAYLRGVRGYLATLQRPDGRHELATILARYTTLQAPSIHERMQFVDLDPNGQLDEASVTDQLVWYTQQGLVTTPVDLSQALDPSFVQ